MKKQSKGKKFIAIAKECGLKVAIIKGLASFFRIKGYRFVRESEIKVSAPVSSDINTVDKSYRLPEILTQEVCPKRYEIAACAFRPQNAKGGPGAVLYTMRTILGNQNDGIRIKYFFKNNVTIPANLEKALNGLPEIIKINFYAAYYIQRGIDIWSVCDAKTDVFFVCHDLGSAYGAYLCNRKYVLVYHNQGSIYNEAIGAGLDIDDVSKGIIDAMESVVMNNAQRVYFPSAGAQKEYLSTCGFDYSNVKFGNPLYNTIPDKPLNLDINGVNLEFGIERIKKHGYEIFLSVGDYNENKGIDRVPNFLKRYVELTHKKVYWIVAGNRQNTGIYESFLDEEYGWPFRAFIIGDRIPHDKILSLMELSDFYIMLHRKSIFDLATLEAMRAGLVPILTNVGGNPEFNCKDNAIIVDIDNLDQAIEKLKNVNLPEMKKLNREVFNSDFSHDRFQVSYTKMLKDEMEELNIYPRFKSLINKLNLSGFKDKFYGKTAVICGGGASLQNYKGIPGAIHIALNKTLFYDKIKFDMLFMQDYPELDKQHTMDDYNNYSCDKFYGYITNPMFKNMGFKNENFGTSNGKIYRYELAPRVYDASIDNYEFELDKYCMVDAQSVLFSALQFAVFAGFKKIYLVGVDFSDTNYDNSHNESKYARAVSNNLVVFKRKLRLYDESVDLNVISCTNRIIRANLGVYDDIITVTGIYTNSYAKVLKLQKNSCVDNFRFDFRYITDAEWEKAKTSKDFAFFGGNTIKTQLVIDKIKQYWGHLLLVTDADIIFLKRTEEALRHELGSKDIVFMRERLDTKNAYEKTPMNVNIGFVLMRCNTASLEFWKLVQQKTIEKHGWDQEEANIILRDNLCKLNWALLSDLFLNGNDVSAFNVRKQFICSACGTIAKRFKLPKLQYLTRILNMASKKETKWFDGTPIQDT